MFLSEMWVHFFNISLLFSQLIENSHNFLGMVILSIN